MEQMVARLEKQISELGMNKCVFLKGLIKSPENYFAYSDCVLMPSRYEGLPNVVLEALACGTSVIATAESGGIDEIAEVMKTDNLKVVGSMANFGQELETLKPFNKDDPAQSLLPEEFKRTAVLELFHSFLKELH